MLFRLVLWLLALRLRWLGKRNEEVRQRIAEKDFVMQWRTFDGTPSRWFYFRQQGISSKSGLHSAANTTLNFKDAKYAVQILKEASNNQMAFMQAMQNGDIKVEGDAAGFMWFMSLLPFIAPSGKKKA